MSKSFGNLNKYERAFLRSQLRKKRKNMRTLTSKGSFWSNIKKFLGISPLEKDFFSKTRTVDVSARTKDQEGQHQEHLDIQGIHNDPHDHSESSLMSSPSLSSLFGNNNMKKQKNKKKVKQKKTSSWWTHTKNLFFIGGSAVLIVLIALGVWFTTLEIPDVSNFDQRVISNSTKIYDRTGEITLYDIHENIRRSVISYEDINQYAKDAIVAIEDHTFYEHNGVVISSTLRAVLQTVLSRLGLSDEGTAGGSTLTQQVVKNTLLNSRRLISRKVKEWVLAYKIEQRLTKEQILEIYLNEAPYGGTIYGIEEASRIFFGTSAADLSLGQAAYLAAIPNLPTFYSPYGPNKALLDERQKTVLREMKRYGFITDQEYRDALQEEVEFLSQEENSVKALHFVQYIRAYLEEQYGTDLVENGGLRVVTTLDYKLQERAEEILKEHIEEVEEDFNATNAALVAIESETGHIITMVGSRDYFDEDIDGNFNVAIAERQPGSSFKPLAYASAFEKGYLPETAIFDTKTQFSARCPASDLTSNGNCYSPTNYDNEFEGPMTMRNALAQSRNIPAVKTMYLAGMEETMRLAQEMGINSLNEDENFYGLGLVLGGGEVSLLELTGAYSVFANDGERNPPTGIISVTDPDGNVLEEYQSNEQRVLSRNSARMISSILSDNVARTPLFGSQSFLYFGGRAVAAKTGTTNDNRDAWLVGYTPQVAVGVWTGNNDNSPMRKGSSISGKPWRAFMDEVIDEYDNENFEDYELPENFDELPAMIRGQWEGGSSGSVLIDSRTNRPANAFTPEEFIETITQFEPHTILHWIDKDNPTVLDISTDDPQYRNWEAAVQDYARENFQSQYQDNDNRFDDIQDPESVDSGEEFILEIRGIDDGEEFELSDRQRVSAAFDGISLNDIEKVEFFVNGVFVDSDESQPFGINLDFEEIPGLGYENILQLVARDEDANVISQDLIFFIDDLVGVEAGSNPEFSEAQVDEPEPDDQFSL